MKYIIYILCAIVGLSACTTTEKMTINANPGTKIFTSPNDENPKVVPSSGSVKIEVPSDGYYSYMLAQEPNTGFLIPFGIDCKGNKHMGTKALYVTGATIAIIGLGGIIGGGGAYLGGDSEIGEVFLGGGLGVAAIGSGIAVPIQNRLKQKAYDYNFAYKKYQSVPKDMKLVTLMNVDPEKMSLNPEVVTISKRSKATVGDSKSVNKTSTSKVKKGLKDYGQAIEGIYAGTGKLYKGKIQEEAYDNIRVEIKRESNTSAQVTIMESDEEYFSSPLNYDIAKNKDGSYLLKMKDIPSAIIKIDSKGNLVFSHDKVNIDDETYKLSINGKQTIKSNKGENNNTIKSIELSLIGQWEKKGVPATLSFLKEKLFYYSMSTLLFDDISIYGDWKVLSPNTLQFEYDNETITVKIISITSEKLVLEATGDGNWIKGEYVKIIN